MLFFKAIVPRSCSGQLAKAASQSCCPKLLPEGCDASNLYPKTSPRSYSAKRLPKAAPESCYWKLFPEVVCVQADRNIIVVINWGHAVIDCGLQFLGRNSEQPCGLHRGHRHRFNMTKCVAIWKYATGLVV